MKRRGDMVPVPLDGEDIGSSHWDDARHWLGVYADLLKFKVGLLDRVARELSRLPEVAQRAASVDLDIIRAQMAGYQARLDLWYERLWDLQGLRVDPDGDLVRHQGREVALTKRESQLLGFLLDHPHRYFSATQIMTRAWSDPDLFPEEVRDYVQRVRKILRQLEVPCELTNRPGLGYSLVFRER